MTAAGGKPPGWRGLGRDGFLHRLQGRPNPEWKRKPRQRVRCFKFARANQLFSMSARDETANCKSEILDYGIGTKSDPSLSKESIRRQLVRIETLTRSAGKGCR